jgi:CheY-like chemotaxis protein
MASQNGRHGEAEAPKGPTVLIADDDAGVRQLLHAALDRRYHVLEARNGRDALKVFSALKSPPALAILDIVMPVMGGLEVIAQLRALGLRTPVIATTCASAAQDDFLDVAARLGCTEGIVKPFTAEAIVELADRLAAA